MKHLLCTIGAAALLAISAAPSKADDAFNEDVERSIYAEVGDGFVECSAIFTFVEQCGQNGGHADLVKKYGDAANDSYKAAALAYARARVNKKAARRKTLFITNGIMNKVDRSCVNITAIHDEIKACVMRIKNVNVYVNLIANKVATAMMKAREGNK